MTIQNKIIIKKVSVLLFLVFALIGNVFSATPVNSCTINGTVTDSITGEGLPFASVQIFSQSISKVSKGS